MTNKEILLKAAELVKDNWRGEAFSCSIFLKAVAEEFDEIEEKNDERSYHDR
jgi:hypothetical protein